MARALSNDLRTRLVSAVGGGMSRRAAGRCFRGAPSTAIKWVSQWRRSGHVRPRLQGGDRRSHRLEAYSAEILALADEMPDITLLEIAAYLEEVHGVRVAQSTVWRLLDRHGMAFKKNRARRRTVAA
ncbi:hypothetical protein CCR80_03955 [Rhodothalassium salexigens]|uniref:helix-turn-helix domain-containing protein n=1 Tax=Rhodothalassium salexigens TaxID=1086 RepID=UPI001913CD92|nr:hypothetical protein [Rhodothalassium salexigens]